MPPKLTYNIIYWCNNGDRKAGTTFSCPTRGQNRSGMANQKKYSG